MGFKILSWNVNGLRSFKQPMKEFLNELNGDIICLQETKITRDMLTEDLALVEGYTSYFAFSRRRSGYSGVATYAKNSCTPLFACEGLTGVLTKALSEPSSQESTDTRDLGDGKHYDSSRSCHLEGLSAASNWDKMKQDDKILNSQHSRTEGTLKDQEARESCVSEVVKAATCKLVGDWNRHELRELDSEGRTVLTVHNFSSPTSGAPCPLAVINVYCPRADPTRDDRALYKLQFYRALRCRAALLSKAGARVVVLGDVNTSHTVLDHCDPDGEFHLNPGRQFLDQFLRKVEVLRGEDGSWAFANDSDALTTERTDETARPSDENARPSDEIARPSRENASPSDKLETDDNQEQHRYSSDGSDDFSLGEKSDDDHTSEEVDKTSTCTVSEEFIDAFQMVDTFRCMYPKRKDAFSCWNTMSNARETNYGTRLDYIFCDRLLLRHVRDSLVLQQVLGSDHCPVALLVLGELLASPTAPEYCTKHFREFQGQQQKLMNYFQKVGKVKEVKVMESGSCEINSFEDRYADCDVGGSKQTSNCPLEEKRNPLQKFLSLSQSERRNDRVDPLSNDDSIQKSSLGSSNLKTKLRNTDKQNPKRQQSNLLSFFGAKRIRRDQETDSMQAQDTPVSNGSEGKPKKPLSLYEEEMLFLKNNPDVYKRLGLADGEEVDMEVLNNTTVHQNGEIYSNNRKHTSDVLNDQRYPGDTQLNRKEDVRTDSLQRTNASKEIFQISCPSSTKPYKSEHDDARVATLTKRGATEIATLSEGTDPNDAALPQRAAPNVVAHQEGAAPYDDSLSEKAAPYIDALSGIAANVSLKECEACDVPILPEGGVSNITSSLAETPAPPTAKASAWSFMHQKLEVPLCPGHKEPCALRTTRKKGPNFNRRFFACSRGVGRPGDKDAQCNFFKWI